LSTFKLIILGNDFVDMIVSGSGPPSRLRLGQGFRDEQRERRGGAKAPLALEAFIQLCNCGRDEFTPQSKRKSTTDRAGHSALQTYF